MKNFDAIKADNMKIIVIKIGSSVLLNRKNRLDQVCISNIADQTLALRKKGLAVILVVSGAVAYGSNFINLADNANNLRQLAAGIGQIHVIAALKDMLTKHKIKIAQILLTRDHLKSRAKRQKLKEILSLYSQNGFIPIINENDVLDLNSFGGNDLLAADIARIVKAEKLLILSTMEGSVYGVGGGVIKQAVVDSLAKNFIEAKILNGKTKGILLKTLL